MHGSYKDLSCKFQVLALSTRWFHGMCLSLHVRLVVACLFYHSINDDFMFFHMILTHFMEQFFTFMFMDTFHKHAFRHVLVKNSQNQVVILCLHDMEVLFQINKWFGNGSVLISLIYCYSYSNMSSSITGLSLLQDCDYAAHYARLILAPSVVGALA